MSDQSELPQPFPLRPLFQALGLYGFLLRVERSEKEKGFAHDVLSLFPIGLLVVTEQKGQFPSGQGRFGKIL